MTSSSAARRILLVGVCWLGVTGETHAQDNAWERQGFRDSTAARIVLAGILGVLTHDLARGARDTSYVGWTFSFPPSDAVFDWRAIESELARLLRARRVESSDSVRRSLTVGRVHSDSDSLIVEFMVSGMHRCPIGADWRGAQTGFDIRISWPQFTWEPRARAILHGDAIVCRPPRTP